MNLRIGKILGIPIKIDISWLVIFALIVFSLSGGYFRVNFPQLTPAMDWIGGILAALLLFASVLLHELMHSFVAQRNKLKVGGITLFIFGGVSQLMEEPMTPEIELKMALAGPITSLVLGVAILVALKYIGTSFGTLTAAILYYLGRINIILGVFNMIPGFPLDGGRVLRAVLWRSMNNLDGATRIASKVGQGFGYAFIFGGFWIMLAGQGLDGLWFVVIGWFLNNAAQQSYRQLVLRNALTGIDVHRVMTTDFPHVDPETNLNDFVHDYLLKYDYIAFPVSKNDQLLGMITVSEVREIPKEQWPDVKVGAVTKPVGEERTIDENDDAFEALMHMAQGNANRLLVVHEGKLKGMVTQESIISIVRTKLQLGM